MPTREELIESYLKAAEVPVTLQEKARSNLENKRSSTLIKAIADAQKQQEEFSLWLSPKRM